MSCCPKNFYSGYAHKRDNMVDSQIIARGIKDKNVIAAMRKVKRHLFVPEKVMRTAYDDKPLSIGLRQTISQPYIVALMTELLALEGDETILEIGTRSGYQTAVIAEIDKQVFSIEIIEYHANRAKELFKKLNYNNIEVKYGDGYYGWHEKAPFDGIIITAAPPKLGVLQNKII
ncbi:protein-L-isoaspartate O-methyltransferase [bacterium]|nr:protein-L-isoaspartate O-methyltransferase [bacterium]